MLELSLLDSKMNQFSASLQAVAAIYTARKYMKYYSSSGLAGDDVQPILPEYGLDESISRQQVKNCAKCFNQLAVLIQKSKVQNIVLKFKHPKYFEVGRIVASINKRHQSRDRDEHPRESRGQ